MAISIQNRNELQNAVVNKDQKALNLLAKEIDRVDFADFFSCLTIDEMIYVINHLKSEFKSEIFYYLPIDTQELLIETLDNESIKKIVKLYTPNELTIIVEDLSTYAKEKVLELTDSHITKNVNYQIDKKIENATTLMNSNVLALHYEEKVSSCLKKIKQRASEVNESSTYFVVDDSYKLIGEVDLKTLFFSDQKIQVKKIMDENPISVIETTDQEEVASTFSKYEYSHLPVVDLNNKFMGIISYDDVIDVLEEEATEDIQKSAAIAPVKQPYLQVPIYSMTRARIKWLAFLMISATFSQLAISSFTDWIQDNSASFFIGVQSLIALIAVLPVISGTAGNAGSQSSTMVIRALALGEISTKDYRKIMRTEVLTAGCVGVLLACINFIRMWIVFVIFNNHFSSEGPLLLDEYQWKIIFATFFALIFAVFLAKSVGASLPIIAKKFKVDPALMAAPLLTTLTDALATTIFFLLNILFFVLLNTWGGPTP